jgi:HrpA-like RNA helicase
MDETKFPISAVKNEIFDSFQENQITIISTPTSSGKSMLVPYYAFQYTAKQVYCTVPRRILATEGMRSSNDIHGENFAGYIHGEGEENIDSSVCYITEGSFIMRDIASNVPNDSIICFDEVHEQGKILETLAKVSGSCGSGPLPSGYQLPKADPTPIRFRSKSPNRLLWQWKTS